MRQWRSVLHRLRRANQGLPRSVTRETSESEIDSDDLAEGAAAEIGDNPSRISLGQGRIGAE
ncbi:hypothetical protein Dimus_002119 [Dionaea muscipula]